MTKDISKRIGRSPQPLVLAFRKVTGEVFPRESGLELQSRVESFNPFLLLAKLTHAVSEV